MDVEDMSHHLSLFDLPLDILSTIASYLDHESLASFSLVSARAAAVVNFVDQNNYCQGLNEPEIDMDCLPSGIILSVFKLLDRQSLGRVAQVSYFILFFFRRRK